jgi:hypothetical protein
MQQLSCVSRQLLFLLSWNEQNDQARWEQVKEWNWIYNLLQRRVIEPYSMAAYGNNVLMGGVEGSEAVAQAADQGVQRLVIAPDDSHQIWTGKHIVGRFRLVGTT